MHWDMRGSEIFSLKKTPRQSDQPFKSYSRFSAENGTFLAIFDPPKTRKIATFSSTHKNPPSQRQ